LELTAKLLKGQELPEEKPTCVVNKRNRSFLTYYSVAIKNNESLPAKSSYPAFYSYMSSKG